MRTRGTVSTSSIETAIRDLDRSVPVFNDRTVEQVMREAGSRRRVAAIVLSVFAGAAVLLAAIGLYGVIAQSVSRAAAGNRRPHGAWRDARARSSGCSFDTDWSSWLSGSDAASLATLAAAQSLASLVFGVTTTDPATLAGVAVLLAAVTLLACYLPSRSATRVDPLAALRSE